MHSARNWKQGEHRPIVMHEGADGTEAMGKLPDEPKPAGRKRHTHREQDRREEPEYLTNCYLGYCEELDRLEALKKRDNSGQAREN